jgi:hypothetical protein
MPKILVGISLGEKSKPAFFDRKIKKLPLIHLIRKQQYIDTFHSGKKCALLFLHIHMFAALFCWFVFGQRPKEKNRRNNENKRQNNITRAQISSTEKKPEFSILHGSKNEFESLPFRSLHRIYNSDCDMLHGGEFLVMCPVVGKERRSFGILGQEIVSDY